MSTQDSPWPIRTAQVQSQCQVGRPSGNKIICIHWNDRVQSATTKMVRSIQQLTWDGNLFPFQLSVRHVQVGGPASFTRITVRPRSVWFAQCSPQSSLVDLWFSVFQLRGKEKDRKVPRARSFLFSKWGMLGPIEERLIMPPQCKCRNLLYTRHCCTTLL